MNRKDYRLIADAFTDVDVQDGCEIDMHYRLASALADVLEADNARFDVAKFMAACGARNPANERNYA